MAGVGEASAVVTLIATAAKLSETAINVARKYKNAKSQIESFGREVGMLGQILDQLSKLLVEENAPIDNSVKMLIRQIVNECSGMFSQLDTFNNRLHSGSSSSSPQSVSRRGKAKWVFEKTELEYLCARVESMKTNILLLMMLQSLRDSKR